MAHHADFLPDSAFLAQQKANKNCSTKTQQPANNFKNINAEKSAHFAKATMPSPEAENIATNAEYAQKRTSFASLSSGDVAREKAPLDLFCSERACNKSIRPHIAPHAVNAYDTAAAMPCKAKTIPECCEILKLPAPQSAGTKINAAQTADDTKSCAGFFDKSDISRLIDANSHETKMVSPENCERQTCPPENPKSITAD